MTRRILVPVDGSTKAKRALEFAIEEFPNAEITALHVVDPVEAIYGAEYVSESVLEAQAERAEQLLEEMAELAATHDAEIDTELRNGNPSREIIAAAEEDEYDQIIVGSHGRTGLSRIVLGSVAENIVRRAPVPVTVVR